MSTDEPNPFRDKDIEPNPFADDLADDEIPADPYASPQEGGGGYDTQVAGHYDTMSPGRGGTLMMLAATGLMITIVGLVPFMCCMPVNVLGLAFSLPAWIMAKSDLKGIELGAIGEEAHRSTRAAYLMGMVGTILGLVIPPAVLGALLFFNAGTQAMRSFFDSLGF